MTRDAGVCRCPSHRTSHCVMTSGQRSAAGLATGVTTTSTGQGTSSILTLILPESRYNNYNYNNLQSV